MKKLLVIIIAFILVEYAGIAQSVCFYQHKDFGGVQYCVNRSELEIGQYSSIINTYIDNGKIVTRIPSLGNFHNWGDAISSFKFIGNVESATFYYDANFKGRSFYAEGTSVMSIIN